MQCLKVVEGGVNELKLVVQPVCDDICSSFKKQADSFQPNTMHHYAHLSIVKG